MIRTIMKKKTEFNGYAESNQMELKFVAESNRLCFHRTTHL